MVVALGLVAFGVMPVSQLWVEDLVGLPVGLSLVIPAIFLALLQVPLVFVRLAVVIFLPSWGKLGVAIDLECAALVN